MVIGAWQGTLHGIAKTPSISGLQKKQLTVGSILLYDDRVAMVTER